MTPIPLESSASAYSRTASWEAASITTSGRAAMSFCTPTTKGALNSRASSLPRDLSPRPATATTVAPPIAPERTCSRNSLAMTPPPRSPTRTSTRPGFSLQEPLAHLVHVDDEALVRAVRDLFRSGGDRRLEDDPAAFHLDQLHRHGDGFAEKRRPDVLPVDLGADRILARVEVPEQEVPAGVFDVADDARGRVDAAVLSHELDHPRVVDDEIPGVSEAGFQAGLHDSPRRSACDPRGSYRSRARRSSGSGNWCFPR